MCKTAFSGMVFRPNGDVNPCCLLPHVKLGNIKKNTIEEMFQSKNAKALRGEFLSNNPVTCQDNINSRSCHLWDDHLELSPQEVLRPIKIDLRLNGLCNLECIMCDVWKQENGTYTEENFWATGRLDLFKNIQEMKVLGGEPFIQRDFYKLVHEVVEVNPLCKWLLWTNAAWDFNPFFESLLDSIPQITMLTVSFDSPAKETFEKIRLKSKFEQVVHTIDQLVSYRKKRIAQGLSSFYFQLDLVAQDLNKNEIEKYINFCQEREIGVGFFFLYHPNSMSLLELDVNERVRLLENYFQLLEKYKIQKLLALIKPLLLSLPNEEKLLFVNRDRLICEVEQMPLSFRAEYSF